MPRKAATGGGLRPSCRYFPHARAAQFADQVARYGNAIIICPSAMQWPKRWGPGGSDNCWSQLNQLPRHWRFTLETGGWDLEQVKLEVGL